MQVLESEFVVFCDIDQTLVMHNDQGLYSVANPYTQSMVNFDLNWPHIELLKQYKERGMAVALWSAAGYKWAQVIANFVNKQFPLDPLHVDLILTKPIKFVDDLEAHEVLGQRVYLE